MARWRKDETEFEVGVYYNEEKGSSIKIPKPILEKMDHPDKLKFIINGRNVTVVPSKNQNTNPKPVKIKRIKKEN